MRKVVLLLVLLAGFVAGCENKYKDPDPQAMGYDYYPLEVGDYRVYDVMDIRFTGNRGDTTRFQMRERVDTSFHDQTNNLVYKVVRSVRFSQNSAWLDDSVLVVEKTEQMILLTKNNIKHVKLVFPVKEGKKWIGDAYNSHVTGDSAAALPLRKESYTYTNIGSPFEINNQNFEKTVTVVQGTPYDNVQLDNRKEVYALGIGRVYRLFNRAVYCQGTGLTDCPKDVDDFKQSGHERHEILIDHGKL